MFAGSPVAFVFTRIPCIAAEKMILKIVLLSRHAGGGGSFVGKTLRGKREREEDKDCKDVSWSKILKHTLGHEDVGDLCLKLWWEFYLGMW